MEPSGSDEKLDKSVDVGTEQKPYLYMNWGSKRSSIVIDPVDPDRAYNKLTDNLHFEIRELFI